MEVNLEKQVKERLEEIVERGKIENQEERILISTTALLWEFLQTKSDQGIEIKAQVEERKKEVGFFFPPITEAIFKWMSEGKEEIPEKIKKLAEEIQE